MSKPAQIRWEDASKKQQLARWENVLRVLRGLTPHERRKHWDMSYWGRPTECGTIACAAGHCALDPWFRKRGFASMLGEGTGTEWLGWEYFGPRDFFGHGAQKIFHDCTPRSVGAVIKEVQRHIKDLKLGIYEF
jgi:hypothetical protein